MYSFIWSISQNGRFALKKEKKLRVLSCYCWAITGRQRRRHVSCYQSLPQFSPPTLPAPPPFWHLSHVRQITSAGFEFFSRCYFCFRQKGNALRRLSRLKWHAHTHTHTHRYAHACTRSLTHSDNYTNDRKSAHNAHESIKSGRERKCDVCMQWEAQRNGEIIKYTHPHTHTPMRRHTHTHVHNCMPIKPMLEPCWRQKGRKDAPPGQGQHRLCPRAAINKRRAAK